MDLPSSISDAAVGALALLAVQYALDERITLRRDRRIRQRDALDTVAARLEEFLNVVADEPAAFTTVRTASTRLMRAAAYLSEPETKHRALAAANAGLAVARSEPGADRDRFVDESVDLLEEVITMSNEIGASRRARRRARAATRPRAPRG